MWSISLDNCSMSSFKNWHIHLIICMYNSYVSKLVLKEEIEQMIESLLKKSMPLQQRGQSYRNITLFQ